MFNVTSGVPYDIGVPFSDILVPAMDGFFGPQARAGSGSHGADHSLLLGLISMYYIIFFSGYTYLMPCLDSELGL